MHEEEKKALSIQNQDLGRGGEEVKIAGLGFHLEEFECYPRGNGEP